MLLSLKEHNTPTRDISQYMYSKMAPKDDLNTHTQTHTDTHRHYNCKLENSTSIFKYIREEALISM